MHEAVSAGEMHVAEGLLICLSQLPASVCAAAIEIGPV